LVVFPSVTRRRRTFYIISIIRVQTDRNGRNDWFFGALARREDRCGARTRSRSQLFQVVVELDGVVDGREELHRAQLLGPHAVVHVTRHGGHVHEQAGLVELVDQPREHGQPRAVHVVHAGQVEHDALGPDHRLLAAVYRYGDGGQLPVVPAERAVHLVAERVPVGHVQTAGVVDDADAGHLDRPPVPVHVHVQVGVRYAAQHHDAGADAAAEHEEQRHDHAGQQPDVDLDQHHCAVRRYPYGRVRLGRPPHAHHVPHLQQYVLEGHDRDAGQHAPGQRLEQVADPQDDGHQQTGRHDAGHLGAAADCLLGGAARQRRGERQAREERTEHVAHALGQQLLVSVDRVLELLREQQRHGHGDRVRDDRDYRALGDHAHQQVHRRRFEIGQAPLDFAYLQHKNKIVSTSRPSVIGLVSLGKRTRRIL
jgi:hypothetical protein